MIRPELLAQLLRWREAAVGAGALLLGLWWAVTSYGVIRWVGVVFILGGVAILREAVVRLRRPPGGGGAGVVSVTERQITYLSGHGGGAVSLDSLTRVSIRDEGAGPVWHLTDDESRHVAIPANAENADAIFDALVALPGLSEDDAVAALRQGVRGERVLWQTDRRRLS